MGAPEENQKLPPEAYGLRDEIALAFSDVLIAVWDGNAAQGITGGTVRLIRDALLQRKPVIWINTDGSIKYSQPDRFSETRFLLLGADGYNPIMIEDFFAPKQ